MSESGGDGAASWFLGVEFVDDGYGFFGGIDEVDEVEVFGADVAVAEHGFFYPCVEWLPVTAANQYDRKTFAFAGLYQGD